MSSWCIPNKHILKIEGDRNSVPILGSLCRLAASFNKTLQLTQNASFVLCITQRFIVAQKKGRFLGI
jgi:hypothetical protein